MTHSPQHLLGLPWEEAQVMAAQLNGGESLEPLVTAPPKAKVLLGAYRVIGYRQIAAGWQMIIAREQQSS